MPDGVRLSADLYLPDDTAKLKEKMPVLLEYLPYRKHEARSRNYPLYSYFVERGYVVAAVDIRGTGGSEGRLIPHEYSEIEQQDGEAVIDWLSKQLWSNGNVGMFGISWGGFKSIQMAARNIPALKAIIAIDATEDLFQDDVHYMDGIMHLDSWEMSMDLDNARPGAPDYVIDDENFRNRFDTEPWMLTYKNQQRDGPFWDRASVRGRYEDIRIPTFHIGGWTTSPQRRSTGSDAASAAPASVTRKNFCLSCSATIFASPPLLPGPASTSTSLAVSAHSCAARSAAAVPARCISGRSCAASSIRRMSCVR
jgi:putative CocE/NonD family hydrolase